MNLLNTIITVLSKLLKFVNDDVTCKRMGHIKGATKLKQLFYK